MIGWLGSIYSVSAHSLLLLSSPLILIFIVPCNVNVATLLLALNLGAVIEHTTKRLYVRVTLTLINKDEDNKTRQDKTRQVSSVGWEFG